jgi:4-O-beta-D-mannosyl-D-glucose phosphorylase
MKRLFNKRLKQLKSDYKKIITKKNKIDISERSGLYKRLRYPLLADEHIPLEWRYDLNYDSNPHLLERMGINAVFNPGAIKKDGYIYLMCRIEGNDRKSFFAIARSEDGINNWSFPFGPLELEQNEEIDTNVYDMRLIEHEDGWIYGIFCVETKDTSAPAADTQSAVAQAGIIRSRDLKTWMRLPDLKTKSAQQRNVVLFPKFIDGKYGFYTRPQDSFIDAGNGGGIGFGLSEEMICAEVTEERVIDPRVYHTVKEAKNGMGPAPLETKEGWLHLAHGVRNTAAGLRYVLYLFLTSLDDPTRITHCPAGYFLAPKNGERVGDVSNVVFSNGWIETENHEVIIYYASSDTRIHAVITTVNILLDYVKNTPEDPLYSHKSVAQRINLIKKNS